MASRFIEENKMLKKVDTKKWAWVALFLILVLFFTKITPLVVFDSDDWLYVSYRRMPVPIWGHWNPSRVFPELLMPFVSSLGALVLYPLTGDYMGTLTLVFAVTVSLVIVVYIYAACKLVQSKMAISPRLALGVSVLFLILHFLIFKVGDGENYSLFYANDVTCYFYYTIPSLLSFILIAALELHPEWCDLTNGKFHWRKALVILVAYLLVYSNLYCSYLLTLWCGLRILLKIKKPFSLKKLVGKSVFECLVILAWFVSLVFELSGGRAQDFSEKSIAEKLAQALTSYAKIQYSTAFLMFAVVCIAVGGVLLFRNRKEEQTVTTLKMLAYMLVFFVLSIVYLILLSAVTTPTYVSRPEVLLGAYTWGLAILGVLVAYILKKVPALKLLLPVTIFLLFFELNCYGRAFRSNEFGNVNVDAMTDIGNDMVQQFIDATEQGAESLELHIPDLGGKWPLTQSFLGERISHTLYKHRVIPYEIDTVAVLDDSFNAKYRIQYDGNQ